MEMWINNLIRKEHQPSRTNGPTMETPRKKLLILKTPAHKKNPLLKLRKTLENWCKIAWGRTSIPQDAQKPEIAVVTQHHLKP